MGPCSAPRYCPAMDIGSWITRDNINFAVAAAALFTAAGAWRAGHRSANATEDSAAAARDSAAEAKRSADAAIHGVEIANSSLQLQQAAMQPKAKLRIDRINTGVWRLVNEGTGPAENLSFLDEDQDIVRWYDPLGDRLAVGESRDLRAVEMGSPPPFLRFTWDGHFAPAHIPCPPQA